MNLVTRIRKKMVQAINQFSMIDEGDRLMVAVSGGKDSLVMLLLLEEIRRRSERNFSLVPVIVDQKQPGFDLSVYRQWLAAKGFDLKVIEEDTYSVVKEKTKAGKSYCGLCSRLRRGILYSYAKNHGFHKIALGHHMDDLNETLLMNILYSGKLAGMPPKLIADDGVNIVIRPMAFVEEHEIAHYASDLNLPIIPCNLCGSQSGLKRQRIKRLINELRSEDKDVAAKILASQQNIRPSQLLDVRLYPPLA